VLQGDADPPHPGQPAHGGTGVGRHQEREVRGALRRGEAEPDGHVAVRRHLTGADEPQLGDRLVELRVDHPVESAEHTLDGAHPACTNWASSLAAASGWPIPSGTLMPYNLAA